jgi:hypothetical protein
MGALHAEILKQIIKKGYAPSILDLASKFTVEEDVVVASLNALHDYHGVVLHPDKHKIWVIHPFSLAPTNFYVRSNRGEWWGNCAWCSLGIAAILKEDVSITTTLGGQDEQVVFKIMNGFIDRNDLYVHFPIPMRNAWDNVIYTCSNMLVFKNQAQVRQWSIRHDVPVGDIQPLGKIWEFSRKWYGNHLNPEWTKWTMDEAKEIFKDFELSGNIWNLESTSDRF